MQQLRAAWAQRLVERHHGIVEVRHVPEERQGAGRGQFDLRPELVATNAGQARPGLVPDDEGAKGASGAVGLSLEHLHGVADAENQGDTVARHFPAHEAGSAPIPRSRPD